MVETPLLFALKPFFFQWEKPDFGVFLEGRGANSAVVRWDGTFSIEIEIRCTRSGDGYVTDS